MDNGGDRATPAAPSTTDNGGDRTMPAGDLHARIAERLCLYARLMRFDRPIGIYLLLWPTLWALWLAGSGNPGRTVFVVFVAGVVLMRAAGCVINDYVDRHLDAQVARTRTRPLASGAVRPPEALALFGLLVATAFALALQLNIQAILMALPALALAVSYPFMKRLHHLPQAHLGAAFGWAIPMAWVAQTADWPPAGAWVMYAATVLWAMAYDTMYAMADREDDLAAGVKSTAILFGERDRPWIAALHAGAIALLAAAGVLFNLGVWYYAGLAAAVTLAARQLWMIRDRDPAACLRAFADNRWFGAAVFAGLFVELLAE